MRKLCLSVAFVVPGLFAGTAGAQEDMGVTHEAPASEGPGSTEAGLFLGGFISNYFHQFYDPDVMPNREELDRVNPEFGLRFAVFPSRFVGVELEGSLIMASTKISGEGVQIYNGRAQLMLQLPGRITPFAAIGAGINYTSSDDTVLGSDTDFPVHIGGGFRLFATKAIALRVDGRFIRGPSQQDPYTLNASYGEFTLGLSFNPSPGPSTTEVREPLDQDPDKDGVVGSADACPTEAGTNPDGCPTHDKDGDGVMDPADKCVSEPETVNTFQDEDGCPDTMPDTDADGLDDTADKCKDQAEDKDGFQDEDGCPDPDNDADNLMDGLDKCPMQAGPAENNGCPDTDADSDGVVDRLDNCPQEAGAKDNQGCKKKQLVVITKDQLKILDQVYFKTNSAGLDKKSNKLLDNMAFVLQAHPEMVKVRIEGHTDDVGDDAKNLKLSQSRAESVVAYLVKAGVAAERFEAVGFGETKPLVEGKSKKARSANRRVEFNVVPQQ
jgi:outer membrane protein OmpA-like peptidoglycan-associated protein